MVSWQRPSMSNGIISHYTLYYYIDAMEFSVIVEYNGEMVSIDKQKHQQTCNHMNMFLEPVSDHF